VTRIGVCRNGRCPVGRSGERIECYPGPGEYCPDCGERLSPVNAPRDPRMTRVAGVIALLACGVIALVAVRGRTADVTVCSTTMTEGVVGGVARAYDATGGHPPMHLVVGADAHRACDVRFWADTAGDPQLAIGRDALVAVVNPQNPIGRLSVEQLRAIFAGRVTDWSQVGGKAGRIEAYAPNDGSDEARAFGRTLFRGMSIGAPVHWSSSSREVVRNVAAANGDGAIGVVAFSAAVPAKVIALGDGPAPSALSIADRRYPYTVDVLVESDFRTPGSAAAAVLSFARSPAAQAALLRNGDVATGAK
jgi:hypothetical protein